jgi:hypothetical protein
MVQVGKATSMTDFYSGSEGNMIDSVIDRRRDPNSHLSKLRLHLHTPAPSFPTHHLSITSYSSKYPTTETILHPLPRLLRWRHHRGVNAACMMYRNERWRRSFLTNEGRFHCTVPGAARVPPIQRHRWS